MNPGGRHLTLKNSILILERYVYRIFAPYLLPHCSILSYEGAAGFTRLWLQVVSLLDVGGLFASVYAALLPSDLAIRRAGDRITAPVGASMQAEQPTTHWDYSLDRGRLPSFTPPSSRKLRLS